ncbi:MAG: phosphoribosylformylglycinamidine cyclo-ligase [Bacteroidetes bacterium]|nr:phosphoribosylformylglycinamidine cyclo-ligase [Bacteroidota bacterium]
MKNTYKAAGVDIEAGEEVVRKIKPMVKSTFNDKVLSDIGLFGGFYDAKFSDYEHPILVASTDGVGTKLKIAVAMNKHDTIGSCLVNHCVDDILCCGAKPLFFLDYFATGKLNTNITVEIISGFVNACKNNQCALIGGETAEMPTIYSDGEYDMSGTIIGIVEKNKIVNGKKIQPGDVMIGLESSGLHTNGYSLARNILLSNDCTVFTHIDSLGTTIGDALLAVHKSYLKEVYPLVEQELLTGISHITGGGIVGNTSRIMPSNCKMNIDWNSWEMLPIFKLIQEKGKIDDEEMRRTFNLGIGMILITSKNNADKVLEATKIHNSKIIGHIEAI